MLSLEKSHRESDLQINPRNQILIVEDEDLIREMIVVALSEEGYEVKTTANGRTAMNL